MATHRANLAVVLRRRGRSEEALELLAEAAALAPGDPRIEGHRARALAATGDEDRAREAWTRSRDAFERRLAGKGAAGRDMAGLAVLLASCPEVSLRDPDRALAVARRAIEAAPEEVFWRRALALVLARTGRRAEEALGILTGLRESCDGPRRLADLDLITARVLANVGRWGEARAALDRAVGWIDEHAPKDPDLGRDRAEVEALLAGKGD